jgi:hypothetical protein
MYISHPGWLLRQVIDQEWLIGAAVYPSAVARLYSRSSAACLFEASQRAISNT